ncbi:pou domain transcription factor, putative [Ixodes scapularis]|uniref:POU domain protein n=1 Tax=Ixodes scapularis TaxID=6945 RepID=B7PEU7_IXOSC|nr:pou domain transcription factor, putative [Ixodes scapularis]|eukprot:XP_002433719.1 pou domain transcription factor, putative [Ixodes scapularis]
MAAGPPHVLMAVQAAPPPLQDDAKAAASTAAANGVQLMKAGAGGGMATLVSPGQSLGPLQQTNLVGFAGLQPMAALNLLGQLGPGSQLVQAGQGPSFVQNQGGPLGLLVTSRGTHAQLVNAPHGLGATAQVNSASQQIFLATSGQAQQQGTPILLNSAAVSTALTAQQLFAGNYATLAGNQLASMPQLYANINGQLVAVSSQDSNILGLGGAEELQPLDEEEEQLPPHFLMAMPIACKEPLHQLQAAQLSLSQCKVDTVSAPTQTGQLAVRGLLAPSPPRPPKVTISHTDANIVDGINLEEIKNFAKAFKLRRLSLGLTQTQVGLALSSSEGPSYSQSAICRFEKLDITPKSAQKIKPVLERWMREAEERYRNGERCASDLVGIEPSKKRKQRTSFTPAALEVLNRFFETSRHPSGTEMTELAEELNYDREVVRVWFCNKRQAFKTYMKKLRVGDSSGSDAAPGSGAATGSDNSNTT